MDIGIVTYNPNVEFIAKLVQYVLRNSNVAHCIVVDNGSSNFSELDLAISNITKCVLICNKTNMGIATALCQVMNYKQSNEEWVLFLDQDTDISYEVINVFEQIINSNCFQDVGILCSSCISIHGNSFANNEKALETVVWNGHSISKVTRCITSGSCISRRIYKDVGQFDEQLFIDEVDYEYCFRLQKDGFDILRVDSLSILHEVFDDNIKQIKIGRKTIQYNDVSTFRLYYKIRNYLYLKKKYQTYDNRPFFVLKYILKTCLLETDKRKRLLQIIRGVIDSSM